MIDVPTVPTLSTYCSTWLPRVRSRMRETSADVYDDHVKRFLLPAFGERRLDEIRRAEVVDLTGRWLQRRAVASVALTLCVLRQLYYDAMDAEIVTANPAARFHRHLGKSRVDRAPVPPETIGAALVVIARKQPHAAWILLLAHQSGLRLGEVLGLRWIDIRDGVLYVRRQWYSRLGREGESTKDGRPRRVPLTPAALDVLNRWREINAAATYVHTNPDTGQPYRHGFVQTWWRWARTELRLPRTYTPHSLRHSFGTQLIEASVSERVVQQLLGHSDPRQTYHYTRHATPPVPPTFAAALATRKPPIAVVPTPRVRRRRRA